ncbi:putative intracellular protease/amidase [Staphylococcus warneri]|nr:hypothetical protein DB784_04480 [Staphylococcus warneri]
MCRLENKILFFYAEYWNVKKFSIKKYITSIGGFTTKIDILLDDITDYDLLIMIGDNSLYIEDETHRHFVECAFDINKFIDTIYRVEDYLSR